MTYATQADMVTKYGEQQLIELTDRAAEPVGAIVSAIVDEVLADASAEIDSFAARRYQVPVSPTPSLLRNLCCTIAYYRLHRGRYADETRVDYEDAQRTLTNISTGTVVLDAGGKEPQSAGAQLAYSDADRQFSRKRGEW